MKPTSELFDLIKSLTPSEKRYFKLNAAMQKGNKNYLKLFNAIDKQRTFNEKELREKYSRESFTKNLTFTKNYLYKLLFKSLISFYNEKSIDSKLNNILVRCRLMYNKALFPEFFKTVNLGKKLAAKYERFSLLLEFLELERQLTKKEDIPKKNIEEVYDEELNVLEKIRNANKYKRGVSELFRIQRQQGIVRDERIENLVDDLISGEVFSNEKMAFSITAREKYFFALNIAAEIKGNADAAFGYNKKRFDLISGNREIFQKFLFDNFKDSFASLILSAAAAEKFEEAFKLLNGYRKTLAKNEHKGIDTQLAFYTTAICKAISVKTSGKDLSLISDIEKYLIKFKGKITIDNYNYLYYQLIKFHFITGNMKEALRIINQLFANNTLKFTAHLEPYTRMLNLLIHYELGNHKLLKYLISSSIKYLKSKGKLFKVENTVLDFLKKANGKKRSEMQKEIVLLRDQLSDLKKDKHEKNAFVYIDFLEWANSLSSQKV